MLVNLNNLFLSERSSIKNVKKNNIIPFQGSHLINDCFIKNQLSFNGESKGTEYYDKNALQFFNETNELKCMEQVCDAFLSELPKKSKILDAGCGAGRDSKYFLSKGYKVTAIDGSKELCKLASKNIGQKVYHINYDEVPPKVKYDGVFANAAFVHMNDEELHKSIAGLSKALKKNGVFFTDFKYGDKTIVDGKGRVQHYFNEETIQNLFGEHSDLEVEKMWITEDVLKRPDNDWLNIVLRKK